MKKCYNRHYSANLRKKTLDNSITKYMLLQFQHLGIHLVVPRAFEVINVTFLKRFVLNESPWKITMFFFYVRCVISKVFVLRKTTSFLAATPSKHVPVLDLHTQTAGHGQFW